MNIEDTITTILAFIILFAFFFSIGVGADMIQGKATAHSLGYKSEYKIFVGTILIKPNGEKMLLKQLRYYE